MASCQIAKKKRHANGYCMRKKMKELPKKTQIPTKVVQKTVDKLNDKKLNKCCPMCHQNTLTLVNGYSTLTVYRDLERIADDLDYSPAPTRCFIHIVCETCGYLSMHDVEYFLDWDYTATDDTATRSRSNWSI